MKIILLSFLGLLLISLIIFGYFGAFKRISFNQFHTGGEWIAFRSFRGDYKQSAVVMDEVYQQLLDSHQLHTFQGIGIYYDNPEKVAADQLRADAGCVISAEDAKQLSQHKNLKIKQLPEGDYLVAEFPYKGKLSVLLGLFKVYPGMKNFVKMRGLNPETPVIELYDIPNKKIVYRKFLSAYPHPLS
ncbi:MAG: GyrI-like domain-containing protein [Bacteroidetes bacterium]|nr:GyrI-like domain-containing protein [Bacteroidota bacterium]MBU1579903.1 GyrI-like domain-containing protein [Bacteroidota bacterium]MBU2557781.1 GyrI-like domain-containing protein [Bacteroidota bacterium]